jgi:predicted type IV restriction endonuclease
MGEHAPVCRRVDSVRSASVTRPALIIGAGKPGEVAAGGERRLSEHTFGEGRPLAVLTNGREWSFYLPAGRDAYDERFFYKLDLLHKLDLAEREPGRVIEQRTRRFDFERVLRSRQALDEARCDYDGLHGARFSGRASRSLGATR